MLGLVGADNLNFEDASASCSGGAHPGIAGERERIDTLDDHIQAKSQLLVSQGVRNRIPCRAEGMRQRRRLHDGMLDAIYPQVRCARFGPEERRNRRLTDRRKAPDHYQHLSHQTMLACRRESAAELCLAWLQQCRGRIHQVRDR